MQADKPQKTSMKNAPQTHVATSMRMQKHVVAGVKKEPKPSSLLAGFRSCY